MNDETNPTAGYRERELRDASRALAAVENAPLRDRQQGRDDMRDLLSWQSAPRRLAERASWLANGSYGCGAMLLAAEQLARCATPLQRRVLLLTRIAALDHGCTARFASQAYTEQTESQRAAIDAALDRAAADFPSQLASV